MYSEQYIFWQMVLSSPAVIALSGGFAVAIISLVVAILNNWHSSKITRIMLPVLKRHMESL